MIFRTPGFWIKAALTFAIVFLMSYLGNQKADRLQTSLLTAVAGAIGLMIGLWWSSKKSGDKDKFDFD